ncbi:MAG: hypothetical protein JEZ00_17940 [Anaerolineaceae bacterium]|nr:hypothetical protein [Anaerolineaceae bacterium]
MMKYRRAYWVLLSILVIIPQTLACSLLGRLPAFKDGCYLGYAKAWIDKNDNGVWDNTEKPLMGVFFELNDGQRDYNYLYEPISDENGEFFLSIFPNTCVSLEKYELILQATPPQGYRATTPSEIMIPKEELLDSEMDDYLFGFSSEVLP